jgi:hypothetical protein
MDTLPASAKMNKKRFHKLLVAGIILALFGVSVFLFNAYNGTKKAPAPPLSMLELANLIRDEESAGTIASSGFFELERFALNPDEAPRFALYLLPSKTTLSAQAKEAGYSIAFSKLLLADLKEQPALSLAIDSVSIINGTGKPLLDQIETTSGYALKLVRTSFGPLPTLMICMINDKGDLISDELGLVWNPVLCLWDLLHHEGSDERLEMR